MPTVEKVTPSTKMGSSISSGDDMGSEEAREEIARERVKQAELQRRIAKLQAELSEHGDLAETRSGLEEYERSSRAEVEEETAKLETDKQAFSIERYKILSDRTALNEKESRVGQLLASLDEKDSKLRQILSTLKEQQDQWQRAVTDLQKREDLVDEWQKNHKVREMRVGCSEDYKGL